ncbi:unnamed protein product [Leptidea sinapis]|uniref:Major facilitator superfamily (MFS) profile domain-containing protein n=1 Tax=Leptidea sinapis TaxID=189913 RepID=A0A5E4QK82_9NEOP|nr:unnamed protein product [Leptidea sinapis]
MSELQKNSLLNDKIFHEPKKDNTLVKTLRKYCCIQQRWVFGIMGMFGLCNAYTMRVSLNLAITQMVNRTKIETDHYNPDACPSDDFVRNITSKISERPYATLNWNEETQGLILSGFYYGYGITQFLGGYLAEKYKGKWILGIGLLSTAMFTFITPAVIRIGGSTWLFILRVLQGMGEGPTVPGMMIMMSRWTPPHQRAIQSALIFGGALLGNVFGAFISGVIMSGGRDWAYVFYFFGVFGVIWFILWTFLCYSEPNDHPFITKEELEYLNKTYATLNWNEETQGLILSGFYYGYGITQFLGGYLAEKYKGKWILGIGLLSTAMFTFITPAVIRIGGSTWLFILRVLQGMGEGPTVPGMMIMMSRWTPPHQRAIQSALIFGGALLGNVFGAFISGVIMSGGRDWAYVFYFFGVFGVIWFILWTFLCYSEPNDHPFITKEELEYLNKTVTRAEITSKKDPVPWKAIFRSPAALVMTGDSTQWLQICQNICTMSSNLT